MAVETYTKKPVAVQAIQWTGDNYKEIAEFLGYKPEKIKTELAFFVKTLEGDIKASLWDYIIRGVQGEFYPCKPDIFEATYEGDFNV